MPAFLRVGTLIIFNVLQVVNHKKKQYCLVAEDLRSAAVEGENNKETRAVEGVGRADSDGSARFPR